MNPKKQEFAHKKQTSDKIQKDTLVNNLAQVVITEIRRFARFGTIFKILKTWKTPMKDWVSQQLY